MSDELREVVPHSRVQPEREGGERVYVRTGATVACYRRGHEGEGEALFMFTFLTEEHALMLMNDLYYGEYSGG